MTNRVLVEDLHQTVEVGLWVDPGVVQEVSQSEKVDSASEDSQIYLEVLIESDYLGEACQSADQHQIWAVH